MCHESWGSDSETEHSQPAVSRVRSAVVGRLRTGLGGLKEIVRDRMREWIDREDDGGREEVPAGPPADD